MRARPCFAVEIAFMLAAPSTPPSSQTTPETSFVVTGCALGLTPDLANRTVAGREIITLQATADAVRKLDWVVRFGWMGVDLFFVLSG